MITELQLLSFGKFHDRNFPLARLTLFSGPNEAGKTTIFDGLFDALCRPKANATPGRLLQERYGAARSADLKWDSQPYNLSESDFLDLCSISALRHPPRFASSGGWMGSIKSQLFAGGINPGVILGRLEDRASTKGSRRHMRELNRLGSTLAAVQEEQTELERVRSSSLQELEQARAAAARVDELQLRAGELRQQQETEQEIAEQYRRIREREQLQEALASSAEAQAVRERIQSTRVPDDNESELLRELSGRISASEQELHTQQRRRQDMENQLHEQESRLQRLESQIIASGERAALAARLLRRLQQLQPDEHSSPAAQRRQVILAGIAGVAAAVGILWSTAPLLLPLPWSLSLGTGIPLSALTGAAGLYAMLRARRIRRSHAVFASGLQDIREEIRLSLHTSESDGDGSEPSATTAQLIAFLEGIIHEPEQLRTRAALEREALEGTQARLQQLRDEEARLTDSLNDDRTECSRLLAGYGADSLVALETRLDSLGRDRQLLERLSQRVSDIARRYEIANPELLSSELGRRLDGLSPHIRVDPPSEAERRAQAHRLERVQQEIRDTEQQLTELRMEQQRHQAAYDSRFSSLPREFLRIEGEISHISQEIQERRLNREAAELAAQIFRELADDSSQQLAQLSRQVSRWFGDVLQLERRIDFTGFDEEQVQVEDAGGTLRAVNHLSSGTRDAFYLAARLALIAESRLDPGLVILDDPCVTLDPQRTRQSMAVLARFLEVTGHQVIYLSKDPLTDAYIREALPKSAAYRHHELTATQP